MIDSIVIAGTITRKNSGWEVKKQNSGRKTTELVQVDAVSSQLVLNAHG
jgi:hypothetical protein